MEDNLARELEVELEEESLAYDQAYAQPLEQPQEQPQIEEIPQAEPIAKGLTRLEKGLICLIASAVFALILLNVHSSLQLANASRDLQDVNNQMAQTSIEIENLKQQSHELSRYDRIHEIAEKFGLTLHDENIINIAPGE